MGFLRTIIYQKESKAVNCQIQELDDLQVLEKLDVFCYKNNHALIFKKSFQETAKKVKRLTTSVMHIQTMRRATTKDLPNMENTMKSESLTTKSSPKNTLL